METIKVFKWDDKKGYVVQTDVSLEGGETEATIDGLIQSLLASPAVSQVEYRGETFYGWFSNPLEEM